MDKRNPKEYFHEGRTLTWGKDLSSKQMKALREREVFILLGEDGKPYSQVLMDSCGQIRERNLRKKQPKWDIAIKGINV